MLGYFTQGLTLAFPNAAAPGAFVAYLADQVAQRGWRRSWPLSLVPLLSDGPIIAVLVFLLAQAPAWFLQALQIVGGLFLILLAVKAFRTLRAAPSSTVAPQRAGQSFLNGVLMNFINPGPWIFWGTIGAVTLIEAWRTSPAYAVAFIIGFYIILCGGFLAWMTLFAGANKLDPRVPRLLNIVAMLALLALGISRVWAGVMGVL